MNTFRVADSDYFELEYPCHSPEIERWFLMAAKAIPESQSVLIQHINITEKYRE